MTMSKLTDFYTHKVSLQEEVKPYDPQREMLEDQLISFYFSFYNLSDIPFSKLLQNSECYAITADTNTRWNAGRDVH